MKEVSSTMMKKIHGEFTSNIYFFLVMNHGSETLVSHTCCS
jgi:hypothetical protein